MNYQFVVHQKDGNEYLKLYFGQAVAENVRFKGLTGEYLIIEKHDRFLVGRKQETVGKGKSAKTFLYQILFDTESGQVVDRSFTSGNLKQNIIGVEAFFEKAAELTKKKDFSMKYKRQKAFEDTNELSTKLEKAVLEKRMTRKQANTQLKTSMATTDKTINSFVEKL